MSYLKKSLVASAVASFMFGGVAVAADPVGPEYASAASAFFEESTVTGALNFWMRDRTRADVDSNGNQTSKKPNLDHGSMYLSLGFSSGYISDTVGLDLNVYSTFDMWNNASPDHEMNFWGVDNPYDMNPTDSSGCSGAWDSDCTDNGAAFQTAALKFKFGDSVTAKAGYFQPSVPTAMGVNWSFAAGTYTGGEIGANFDDLALGFVYAVEYRAPWFKKSYEFRDGQNKDAGDAYSFGARYNLTPNSSLDIAYAGLTDGPRKNAHIKYKHTTENGWYLSPQVYIMDDEDQYDSTAFQAAFLSSKSVGAYSFRLEGTYTSADSTDTRGNVGNFAYRLTEKYGGSNGAYDIWWNNRSDFNHDGEIGFFGQMSRDFSDLGAPGFSAGINGVYAFGAEAEGYDELIEYSGSVFANYAIQGGPLKGAHLGMYYTRYVNDSDAPNWTGYSNGFQDENDLKVTLVIPMSIK
ncbi:multidrug transporter [Vibrio rotiferianus]|uniref:Porin n=2 Tax=Vibrio rotiferianus TaxID=190895 RepID=A0A510I364_9VIBR|nr:multidrug transporter [Vibrio rotiferianus]TMX49244.1 multidrug transporter [Vibrio rotiferianus]TMX67336.1 multidrug transporter [Vibrio rotiferianus]CAH1582166.1 N-acetylglucosamine-regulated outer membrane porin [Vibrio rotiferianus]CAH1584272.1 N-acetylglucosamine-regulated outer membrane porin [Vibrio rotiferianus]